MRGRVGSMYSVDLENACTGRCCSESRIQLQTAVWAGVDSSYHAYMRAVYNPREGIILNPDPNMSRSGKMEAVVCKG